jgi:hypothetical protein
MQPSKQQPVKKMPYHRPQLVVYGPVRELTRSSPSGPRNDGSKIIGRNRS